MSSSQPSTTLNPRASLFVPRDQLKGTGTRKKKGPSHARVPAAEAQVESSNIELSFAKTKIADIENQINDRNQTIKIYLQKIKLLEANKNDAAREQLYPSTLPSAPDVSYSCPCRTQSQLSSLNSIDIDRRINIVESKISAQKFTSDSVHKETSPVTENINGPVIRETDAPHHSQKPLFSATSDSEFEFEESFPRPDLEPQLNLN